MTEIRMPKLSDTMEEGTILKWVKGEGDEVRRGEVIAEVSSDKASFELEAEADGTLHQMAERGSSHPIGTLIAQIAASEEVLAGVPTAAVHPETPAAVPAGGSAPELRSEVSAERSGAAGPTRPRVSPLARKLAQEVGLDVELITGSGPGGLVVKEDVLAAKPAAGPEGSPRRLGQVPTKMQLAIARRMVAAKSPVPHFYVGADVRMEEALRAVTALRQGSAAGATVTISHLLVKATALALTHRPDVNRSWVDASFQPHAQVNIAIAVALEGGLIAPVLRDADRKSVLEIAEESRRLVQRARRGELRESELTGAGFTISNLGMYGVDDFTAIVSPPESAVLAVGAVQQRPVVTEGRLEVGQVVRLNLSCDHRVIYGAEAAAFLAELRTLLEEPVEWALG